MLFLEPIFLFGFLPIVLIALNFSQKQCWPTLTRIVILLFSLVFYASWDARSIPILLGSLILTFLISNQVARSDQTDGYFSNQRIWLSVGVALNLLILLIPKYWAAIEHLAALLPGLNKVGGFSPWFPVGMSFFAFTQIAYLIDLSRKRVAHADFITLSAFVTFFPHLIAGPILRPSQTITELQNPHPASSHEFDAGLQQLLTGIAKKILVADPLGSFIQPLFVAVDSGVRFNSPTSWLLIICYSLQLYFDFSGYSQMALGLALMMGFRIPINFDAPYRSLSIIDFWRRWHISLSNFLRDYLYIPLGGSRKGQLLRYRNLMITMILGGMWHGSTTNFAIWGFLHGLYLIVAHSFRKFSRASRTRIRGRVYKFFSWFLTLLVVLIAWVPFRTSTFSTTLEFWKAMFSTGASAEVLGISSIIFPLIIGCAWLYREPRTIDVDEVHVTGEVSTVRLLVMGLVLTLAVVMHGTSADFLYARF